MKADEIYFVKGRLKFTQTLGADGMPLSEKNCCNTAPFPSAVIVFRGPPVEGMARNHVRISTLENK